ncbi:MAG: Peptide chain release factor 2 [Candidatus Woesebacteria bacterium GW2011_GWA1_37_7]|uniref:Peptide chain release factor 2 n=1 Tax=Candidatus Woesebacteria bacterium GW2011_GWA1_37_7 TaxID=1618545 RepID=A0A0G0H2Q5_9BACT|nr:MAG: Peptide chain release factor 2 [Candidatus Woesebacteria bacterium GW2011_GWA1_37_7]
MNSTELKTKVDRLAEEFEDIKNSLNLGNKKLKLKEFEIKSSASDFWNDQEKARKLMQEFGDLKNEIDDLETISSNLETLLGLAKEDTLSEDFVNDVDKLEKKFEKFKLKSFLSGDYDSKNALVAIHAGQGGTEAMDWVSMLFRMYIRFCEGKEWKTETVEVSGGEEAGIKSTTFKVEGSYAYGYLKGEAGTHRLVRQSPFNADKLRQTSFALVEVLPELEETDSPGIQIKEEDLEWQFFRSSSQGGQNVQKVSTAVRLKHVPSRIVVTAQAERYQEQNRKIALNLLRAKLWILEQTRKENEKRDLKGEYKPASWGNQIRSYVLHPYKMVKDLRTGVETSNAESVLDGNIADFIEAEIISGLNNKTIN